MYIYKITVDDGEAVFVLAKTYTEAVRKYCSKTDVSESWLNAHCKIKRLGAWISDGFD